MDDREDLNGGECARTRARLSELADGELDAETSAGLVRHMEGCDACRTELGRFQAMLGALDSLPDPEPGEGLRLEALDRMLPRSLANVPEIMGVQDLLNYLGVTREQLLEELDELPAFEFAGQLKFRKSAVDRWIDERQKARARAIDASRVAAWRSRRAVG